jgi:hypothetical protein
MLFAAGEASACRGTKSAVFRTRHTPTKKLDPTGTVLVVRSQRITALRAINDDGALVRRIAAARFGTRNLHTKQGQPDGLDTNTLPKPFSCAFSWRASTL